METLDKIYTDKLHPDLGLHFEERSEICRPMWDKWITDALMYSKYKQATILIMDKQKHMCLLIQNGQLVKDFNIELGVNSLNEKINKGDFATAEGSYYISGKKERTFYNNFKTIILNYPNKEDIQRINSMAESGKISDTNALTDKLTIHGKGDKGYDWTDGSMALSDNDMDYIYSKIKIGTKVVIVGSTAGILAV